MLGLKIVMFFMFYDVKGLLKVVICDDDLVFFFEYKCVYCLIKGEVFEDDYIFLIGKVDVKREGDDIMVIIYGFCVYFVF